MGKGSILAVCLLAVVLITGCATAPQPPATIIGSEETSALLDNFTAFVVSVDGQILSAGRQGWAKPVALAVGRRRLAVEFNRGVFVARAELELEARAGVSYQLKYSTDAELFGKNSYCDFWIVDRATDKAVTSVKRAAISSVKQDR